MVLLKLPFRNNLYADREMSRRAEQVHCISRSLGLRRTEGRDSSARIFRSKNRKISAVSQRLMPTMSSRARNANTDLLWWYRVWIEGQVRILHYTHDACIIYIRTWSLFRELIITGVYITFTIGLRVALT